MKNKEIKKLAQQFWKMEQECQNGNNISENMIKMNKLTDNLTFEDLIEISSYIEENYHKNNLTF